MPPIARPHRPLTALALVGALACGTAWAEKADRSKPLVVESDGKKAATVDLTRRTTSVVGHVVVTQGTMVIRADSVDVREDKPGVFSAVALGSAAEPATFRQKRDRADEVLEGQALRIEVDGPTERIRLIGEARLRVLRAGQLADEASAPLIVYDQPRDTLSFEGGTAPAGAASAPGRPKLVFVPRNAEAASAAGR